MFVEVKDSKSKNVLLPSVRVGSSLDSLKGIMFKPKAFEPLLLDFGKERRVSNSIHSLFCPPFEAVFISEDKEVVAVKSLMKSKLGFIFVPNHKFRYVLEYPLEAWKIPNPASKTGFLFYPNQKLEW